jgi:hypothetical protein
MSDLPITREPLIANVLPSSVARHIKGSVMKNGVEWIPIFCANCGVDGGYVPKPSEHFAFFLCDENQNGCSSKWSPMVDHMVVPQEKFWEVARQEQLERYGREMTEVEILDALKDPNHWVHSLLRSEGEFLKRR